MESRSEGHLHIHKATSTDNLFFNKISQGLDQSGEAAERYLLNGSHSQLQIFTDVIVLTPTRSLPRNYNFTGHVRDYELS